MQQIEVKTRGGTIGYINVSDLTAFVLGDNNEEFPVLFENIHGVYNSIPVRKDQLTYLGFIG